MWNLEKLPVSPFQSQMQQASFSIPTSHVHMFPFGYLKGKRNKQSEKTKKKMMLIGDDNIIRYKLPLRMNFIQSSS